MSLSLIMDGAHSSFDHLFTKQGAQLEVKKKKKVADNLSDDNLQISADLKLQAQLLPELYDTKSNYQLIVNITKFEKNMTVV